MSSWSKDQFNCFNICRSACIVHKDEKLRFLTLTSVGSTDDIFRCFQVFVNRVRVLTINKLIENGYLPKTKSTKKYYYGNKDLDESFKFEYGCVRTSEGVNGVLHILYFGEYLPKRWINDIWLELSGASVSKIEIVDNDKGSINALSKYVSSQDKVNSSVMSYVSTGQGSQFVKFTYSKDFCIPEFQHFWKVRWKQWYLGFNGEGKHDKSFFWKKWCKKLNDFRLHGYLGLFIRAKVGNKKMSWKEVDKLSKECGYLCLFLMYL